MIRMVDAAVLGAGIAGSSMAKAMADKGWETLLIDSRKFPRHKVCGEFLSPESQGMLRSIGVREAVDSLHPAMIHKARLILSHGEELEIALPGPAIGVSRYVLDSALHNAALESGVDVRTGTTVTDVSPHNEGYRIVMRQEGEQTAFHARAVIAAWGSHNRWGTRNHSQQPSLTHTHIGVKSHFIGVEWKPVVELYFFPGGYLGISPVEGGVLNVAALLARDAFPDADKTVSGMIQAAILRNSKLSQRLGSAIPVPGTQAAVAPVDLRRKVQAWDLIPHVGDAVVMVPPLCGDGMSMALRSALLCSRLANSYLRGDSSLSNWRNEYTRSIQREFSGPARWGRFLQTVSALPVFPRIMLSLARIVPGLGTALLDATRLKQTDF